LKYCTRFCIHSDVVKGGGGNKKSWAQALMAHQHTLQSVKNIFLKQSFRPKCAKKQYFIFGKKLQKNTVLVLTSLKGASTHFVVI